MTGRRAVVAALFVDLGEGREIRHGDRAGQIRWTRPPRARFECVACQWASETVTGPEAVKTFIAHIRTTHQAVCTAATERNAA
ncbi:hypothetical protein ACFUJU_13670 [Streptomyces sp. NPDC057235]|uniref:hypothetical protein n=1 Tax=Streptomyces sp. NPDC057235 TaxID=3346058 RepID=UPI0036386F29